MEGSGEDSLCCIRDKQGERCLVGIDVDGARGLFLPVHSSQHLRWAGIENRGETLAAARTVFDIQRFFWDREFDVLADPTDFIEERIDPGIGRAVEEVVETFEYKLPIVPLEQESRGMDLVGGTVNVEYSDNTRVGHPGFSDKLFPIDLVTAEFVRVQIKVVESRVLPGTVVSVVL